MAVVVLPTCVGVIVFTSDALMTAVATIKQVFCFQWKKTSSTCKVSFLLHDSSLIMTHNHFSISHFAIALRTTWKCFKSHQRIWMRKSLINFAFKLNVCWWWTKKNPRYEHFPDKIKGRFSLLIWTHTHHDTRWQKPHQKRKSWKHSTMGSF